MNKEINPRELDFLLRYPVQPGVMSPVDFLSNHSWGGIKVSFSEGRQCLCWYLICFAHDSLLFICMKGWKCGRREQNHHHISEQTLCPHHILIYVHLTAQTHSPNLLKSEMNFNVRKAVSWSLRQDTFMLLLLILLNKSRYTFMVWKTEARTFHMRSLCFQM